MDGFEHRKRARNETTPQSDPSASAEPSAAAAGDGERVTPRTVLSWNADGLMSRFHRRSDMAEFGQLVRRLSPDVVCIQEAMIRAYCANPKAKADSNDRRIRGQPADDEAAKLKEMLHSPFDSYHTSYSLANERKAGTVMLTKKSLGHIPVHCSISSALAAIQAQAEADSHAAAVTTHSPAAAAAVSNTAPAVANISDSASAVTAPAGATVPSRASARPRWPHRAAMRRTVRRRRHGVS